MPPIKPKKRPPSHRVEFALARALEKAVATLPERGADNFGKVVGRAIHRIGIRRELVESNLRLAYPDKDEAWIEATTRAAYEHLGREAAAMLRLSKLDSKQVIDRTVTSGWDQMEVARSHGRGVLLVTGHYG